MRQRELGSRLPPVYSRECQDGDVTGARFFQRRRSSPQRRSRREHIVDQEHTLALDLLRPSNSKRMNRVLPPLRLAQRSLHSRVPFPTKILAKWHANPRSHRFRQCIGTAITTSNRSSSGKTWSRSWLNGPASVFTPPYLKR